MQTLFITHRFIDQAIYTQLNKKYSTRMKSIAFDNPPLILPSDTEISAIKTCGGVMFRSDNEKGLNRPINIVTGS